jgi:hypothetical protein
MRIAVLATPSTAATATRCGSSLRSSIGPTAGCSSTSWRARRACLRSSRKKPHGRIPTLQLEDGTCLAGSNAILGYLVQGHCLHPVRSLGPRPGPAVDVLRAVQPRAVRRNSALHEEASARGLAHRCASGDAAFLCKRALHDCRQRAPCVYPCSRRSRTRPCGVSAPWCLARPRRRSARACAAHPPPLPHQLLRSLRSARNTVRASGASPRSGKLARRRAMICGSCRRKKALMRFSSASVVTRPLAGSC